jgi:hypothetical protein
MTPPIDASEMSSFLHLPQKIPVEQIDVGSQRAWSFVTWRNERATR